MATKHIALNKTVRVIELCKTSDHVISADRYVDLYTKMYGRKYKGYLRAKLDKVSNNIKL